MSKLCRDSRHSRWEKTYAATAGSETPADPLSGSAIWVWAPAAMWPPVLDHTGAPAAGPEEFCWQRHSWKLSAVAVTFPSAHALHPGGHSPSTDRG